MAITVTTPDDDRLLDDLNGVKVTGLRRALRLAAWTLGLILVFGAGVLAQNALGSWWALRTQNQANINAAVIILQYNLQQGKLLMPPQLAAQPAAPAVSPAAPATPKVEAPPPKK